MKDTFISTGIPKFRYYMDCAGVSHCFVNNITPIEGGVGFIAEAKETNAGEQPGYSFTSKPALTPLLAYHNLHQQIEAELSRKYLYQNEHSLSVHANEIAGVITGNGFIVDGKQITGEQFLTLLQTYEGAGFRIFIKEQGC